MRTISSKRRNIIILSNDLTAVDVWVVVVAVAFADFGIMEKVHVDLEQTASSFTIKSRLATFSMQVFPAQPQNLE